MTGITTLGRIGIRARTVRNAPFPDIQLAIPYFEMRTLWV
jgi:hypothetical protein